MEEYPTKKDLEIVSNYKVKDFDSFKGLADFILSIWHWEDWATLRGKTLRLATGGWSGNEEIIGAIEKNTMFQMMCWQKSQRGGLHIYRFPKMANKAND